MSLNLTVTIPLEIAAVIRRGYDLQKTDLDIDAALLMVANTVIDAVKALPYSITAASCPELGRSDSPCASMTPPSSTYSRDFYSRGSSGCSADRQLPDFDSSSASSSRSASDSAQAISSATSTNSDSWWSAREGYAGEFSVDVCYVEDGEDRTYYVVVTSGTTLGELESKLEDLLDIPTHEQKLVWRGYKLNQPDATLATYGISDGSKLHLIRKAPTLSTPATSPFEEYMPYRPKPGYEICVQTLCGKRVSVDVRSETTTAELASSIFEKQGICPRLQRLVHRGHVIFDGHAYQNGETHLIYTLEEIGVGPNAVVFLHFCNTFR